MKAIRSLVGRPDLRRFPWLLLIGALVLSGVGVAFIRSSHSAGLAMKHLAFTGIGLGAFALIGLVDYRRLAGLALPLYVAGLASLVALFAMGVTLNYARRWFDLGPVHVQPAEPIKYVLVLVLADYFCVRHRVGRLRDLLPPLVLTCAPMLLIALQPDLGTALTLAPVFVAIAFLAGVPLRNLALLALAGCVLVAGAWFTPGVLKDYQRDRILGLVHPGGDPHSHAAYNAEQAMLAIRAGGLAGQGWGQGVLTRLGRIPEQYADFIFPVIAEEWGFARTALLLGLYVAMMVLLGLAARGTPDGFGRLIVGGVLALFAFQTFLHVAISLRLAPITGLTLPLVSYGGSSLVSTYAGFGLVASVRMHRERDFSEDAAGQ